MAKRQTKKTARSNTTIKYEKGHKIKRLLTPTRSKKNRETLLNISMTCTLS
jgi:hypothetical protein